MTTYPKVHHPMLSPDVLRLLELQARISNSVMPCIPPSLITALEIQARFARTELVKLTQISLDASQSLSKISATSDWKEAVRALQLTIVPMQTHIKQIKEKNTFNSSFTQNFEVLENNITIAQEILTSEINEVANSSSSDETYCTIEITSDEVAAINLDVEPLYESYKVAQNEPTPENLMSTNILVSEMLQEIKMLKQNSIYHLNLKEKEDLNKTVESKRAYELIVLQTIIQIICAVISVLQLAQ